MVGGLDGVERKRYLYSFGLWGPKELPLFQGVSYPLVPALLADTLLTSLLSSGRGAMLYTQGLRPSDVTG